MTNFTSVNPTVFHPHLPPPGSPPGTGLSGGGSGPMTLGSVVEPRNRKERRKLHQLARPTPKDRDTPSKEEAHRRLVRHIKKDLKSKGVTLPVQAETSELAPDSFATWGVRTLHAGAHSVLQTLQNAIQWTPGPMLAQAASTCDVNGQCGIEAGADVPPITIADFRKAARGKFSMELSPSLEQREDKTLRNVVVLIADENHMDPKNQADITSLVHGVARSGDQFLVEAAPHDEMAMKAMCRNVEEKGVRCHGIDVGRDTRALNEARQKYVRAMARLCEAVIGKTVFWRGSRPTLQELIGMGEIELTLLYNAHIDEFKKPGGASKFTESELTRLVELVAKAFAKKAEFDEMVSASMAPSNAAFSSEIERLAADADGQATLVVLGGDHVDDIRPWLLESHDAIVLHPTWK
jgi:hypothetical protein